MANCGLTALIWSWKKFWIEKIFWLLDEIDLKSIDISGTSANGLLPPKGLINIYLFEIISTINLINFYAILRLFSYPENIEFLGVHERSINHLCDATGFKF